ncbi:MAG: D-ribose transporter ATP-binding protein [Microbacteriaceae bacterium]|nr:D-ribose transporter ATP-binding protein [Microbacteriaceae bacterium]
MSDTINTATEPIPAIAIKSLTKSFAGVQALKSAELEVRRGEVHALLGVNGSGKSTLIKVLAGFHRPDPGAEIMLGGEPHEAGSASAAHAAGLRFIHQDLGLIDTLTVEENFSLGTKSGRGWLSDRREQKRVQAILDRYEVDIDAKSLALELSPTHRSILAILRAVEDQMGSDGIVVLDEPTAALPRDEVHQLFRIIKRLKATGVTIVYVSHRMPEILEIADRVTVLRDGRTVATAEAADLTLDSLVKLVLGFDLKALSRTAADAELGDVQLSVTGLTGDVVEDFDLEARAGEVIGVTGLLGSGYEDVLGLVFGAAKPYSGSIRLGGLDVTGEDQAHRIANGLAYAPADRKHLGSMPEWSVRENLTLPDPPSHRFMGWMTKRREVAETLEWIEKMDVVPVETEKVFATLSGGNQQKVVMGRWLRMQAKAIMLDEPTNGVDASAKRAIHLALREAAANGAAVIVSSSDIEELVQVCDRVLVMGDGRIRAQLVKGELTDDALNTAVMTATAAA